ncbi:unnamed protein product [Phyllotreta striolata]|uniref:Uncharacterized protein n=1 Tax=Phyllotreta striolata TaxID=444603 RepID=A0A9N9TCR9_PHYSR|nr:unnamed protein product [Phyllotreta striolata]
MPDVSRSDSQRSNTSQKPRVSFNRDVHVKRIVPRENSPVGAVSGDGVRTPLVASPVRKERLKKSKKELSEEAKRVLHQVDRVGCVTSGDGVSTDRFYTLPHRRRKTDTVTASLERRGKRRNSADGSPPKKPPRTFASPEKPSIFDVFKKGKGLRRSASDASSERSDVADENFRRRAGSEGEDFVRGNRSEKKQLSPIIEVTPREDYFSDAVQNKENIEPTSFVRKKQKDSVTAQLKRFIDEVDEELYKETGIRPDAPAEAPQPIIIDVEKAEQINKKKKKFRNSLLGKKLKFAIRKKKKHANESNEAKRNNKPQDLTPDHQKDPALGHQVQETIDTLLHPKDSPKMIHSSQMPPEKLPLTKGRMVNNLVKRLSYESSSPPPLTSNVMITPHGSVQHNNNQPFSYTRGLNETSPTPGSPIIYAQVVCGGANKQTIHTAYNGKKHSQSDSDEGLGGEEHSVFKSITHIDEVDKFEEETPITPRIRNPGYNSYERKVRYVDSSARGRGDGMDSKRRESFTENNNFASNSYTGRQDLSARRDQLESRINRRVNDNSLRTSPEYLKNPDTTSKYFYKGRSSSPVGYKYVTKYAEYETRMKSFTPSPETPDYIPKRESFHKSTPDIYCRSRQDSLQRASSNCRSDYLHADSGIENDFRRDSGDNSRSRSKHKSDFCAESEDEGFASSLLIASERQHTENGVNRRRNGDRDSERAASREDDRYRREHERRVSGDYAPRERSIDDGSHYDPRIDKDVEVFTLRRSEKKPPKPEKKSSLEKVKSLFTRDSKKKKEKNLANHGMVREESLRARYVEYKGREPVEHKYKNGDIDKQPNFDYSNRRRLPTPSPSPTRDHPRRVKSESTHGSWFKSLDRLSRKKSKKGEKEDFTTVTDEEPATKPTKNLRFFGDTDQESNDSLRRKSASKTRPGTPSKPKSQSTKELRRLPDDYKSKSYYKSLTNVSEHHDKENKSSRFISKPPASPNRRTPSRETNRHDKERTRRRKNEVSSVESSTEGDSSQQSQRSIVYLHAATVGDIPGPGYLKSGRRAASREELASNGGARVQNVKTLSRSFSVLAPWRPRHSREALDIDYAPPPSRNGKFEQKGGRSSTGRKESSSTLKKKAQESKRNQNGSTLLKLSKSRESLGRSRDELSKGSNSTLYKKKERLPKENSRYNRDRDEKKLASKSLSTESLGGQERRYRDVREISRSVSMPRNPDKSAGWYKK